MGSYESNQRNPKILPLLSLGVNTRQIIAEIACFCPVFGAYYAIY
jgi:hypothetical protein